MREGEREDHGNTRYMKLYGRTDEGRDFLKRIGGSEGGEGEWKSEREGESKKIEQEEQEFVSRNGIQRGEGEERDN